MEDLLELYQLPYDSRFPVVGMDEMPKQLIAETRIPLPVCEGHPMLYDYEYERKGVCNLFLFVEPLRG
ncbi:MAG TPA: IS630 family transposase, partial [Isosphaeraceae bacterium]|nr:IS630 family transposase [Isosphaeraceae bacterium]